MKLQKNIVILLLATFYMLLVTACGYKPASHYIKNVFHEMVYVEVKVDRAEPENAPYIKDEINRMIYTRFKDRVGSKAEAESELYVSYKGSTFIPLTYQNGYVSRYRVNVRLQFDMVTKLGKMSKTITAVQEADIEESALSSSTLRIEAIGKGAKKALDQFLAYVSAKGAVSRSREQGAGSK